MKWLGGKDSNLRYRIQSPGPYRLATAHRTKLLRQEFTRSRHIGSHIVKRFWTTALGENLMIFRDDFLFDHPPSLIIDRMSDILVGSVFALFAGHRDEVPS